MNHSPLCALDSLAVSGLGRAWWAGFKEPQPAPGTKSSRLHALLLLGLSQGGCPLLTLFSLPPAPPVILGETVALVEEVTVNANSTVSLYCPALGSPAPTISWLQNGLPFSPSPRLQVLEGGRILQVRATPPTPAQA